MAGKILSRIAAAMSVDSRVLVVDLVTPKRAEPGVDLTPLWMDYAMMAVGGKERTEEEFALLFRDAGLELVTTWMTEGSSWAVLEGRAMGVVTPSN